MIEKLKGKYIHLLSQFSYVAISFSYFSLKREVSWHIITLLTAISLYAITRAISKVRTDYAINWFLSALLIGNSVFLNLEGHNVWTYIIAVFVGILGITIFRKNNLHVFNPSAIGVLAVVMFWPGQASLGDWAQAEWLLLWILLMGNITVWAAQTTRISYGYILGYVLAAFPVYYLHKIIGTSSYAVIKPLFWPLTILAPGALIFIFHVISDPITSPKTKEGMWAFGATIGVLDIALRGLSFLPAPFVSYLIIQVVHAQSPQLFDSVGKNLIVRLESVLMFDKLIYGFGKIRQLTVTKYTLKAAKYALIFIAISAFSITYLLEYTKGIMDKREPVRVTLYERYILAGTMYDTEKVLNALTVAAAKNDLAAAEKIAFDGAVNQMVARLPWIGAYMPKEFRSIATDGHALFGTTALDIKEGRIRTEAQLSKRIAEHQQRCITCHEKFRYDLTLFRVP